MNSRWWVYQKTRFPLLAHGPMVVIFCLAVLTFAALGRSDLPTVQAVLAASVSAILLFFQLRVADEFKDFETDAEFRPHRPVPSGLVHLHELARLAVLGGVLQFAIALWFDVGLVPLLFLVWLYMGLMTREFFVPNWLTRRPAVYLLSHMVVMPLIAFYISAFDWLPTSRTVPGGTGWLMFLAFGCGIVLEIGRKIRSPGAEQKGVETYSSLWGGPVSVMVWVLAVVASVYAYVNAAHDLSTGSFYLWPGLLAAVVGAAIAGAYLADDRDRAAARWIEPGSGAVAMLLYLGLGPLQIAFH